MTTSRILSTLAAAAVLAAGAGNAAAETIFGITDAAAASLIRFDSATPGTVTTIGAISGIVAGQTLYGIDFRPSNGLLYGVSAAGTAAQLYTINTSTGAATAVGSGFTLAANTSTRVSIDFNPVADALRVVTGSGQSYRVNANTGALILQDTSLTYGTPYLVGAVQQTGTPLIGDVAYSNSVAGATQTTLYAYDFINDFLATVGSVNGTPNSPNGGVLSFVGSVGGPSAFSAAIGFDISGATGIGYISLDDSPTATGASEFYRVNLSTGALTFVGTINGAASTLGTLDISVQAVPEASTLAMTLAGLALMGGAAWRRRSRDVGRA